MKNVEFYSNTNPEIAFVLRFKDSHYEEGKKLALEGFTAWCFGEKTEHISQKDAETIHDYFGYTEASAELLDNAGIDYELADWLDEEGELLPEYANEEIEEYCHP